MGSKFFPTYRATFADTRSTCKIDCPGKVPFKYEMLNNVDVGSPVYIYEGTCDRVSWSMRVLGDLVGPQCWPYEIVHLIMLRLRYMYS